MEERKKGKGRIVQEIKPAGMPRGLERIFFRGEKEFGVEKRYREEGLFIVRSVCDELLWLRWKFSNSTKLA